MTGIWIFAALCAWGIATAIICYVVFRFGYNLGWEERQRSMVLPRNITASIGKRTDTEQQHHRHSAMDPTKIF